MDLYAYISDIPRRQALAEACDTIPDYLWQLATGRRKPSPSLARRIEEATERLGPEKVSKEELIFGPPPSSKEGEAA
ncbi:hypothetical protein [Rhodanobacter hydrolyticus]|uniref:Helix-turn-helix domain-containing protein n=1 Tax=Rhodanobacter hydrolyticus TaxID=2250595 RepID=A0ABW8J400_9GAMM